MVGDTGLEPVTSSASRKRSPSELAAHTRLFLEAAPGLEPGNEGFAILCLSRLAMPPLERKTGFEPATPTLAR